MAWEKRSKYQSWNLRIIGWSGTMHGGRGGDAVSQSIHIKTTRNQKIMLMGQLGNLVFFPEPMHFLCKLGKKNFTWHQLGLFPHHSLLSTVVSRILGVLLEVIRRFNRSL